MEPIVIRFNQGGNVNGKLFKTIESLDPNMFYILKGPVDALVLLPAKFCDNFSWQPDKIAIVTAPLNSGCGYSSKYISMSVINGEFKKENIQTNCSNFRVFHIQHDEIEKAWDDIEYAQKYITKRDNKTNIRIDKVNIEDPMLFNSFIEGLRNDIPIILKSTGNALILMPTDICAKFHDYDKVCITNGGNLYEQWSWPSEHIGISPTGVFYRNDKKQNNSKFRAIVISNEQIKHAWDEIKRAVDHLKSIPIEVQTLKE
jgi:hypothetical protein